MKKLFFILGIIFIMVAIYLLAFDVTSPGHLYDGYATVTPAQYDEVIGYNNYTKDIVKTTEDGNLYVKFDLVSRQDYPYLSEIKKPLSFNPLNYLPAVICGIIGLAFITRSQT